MNKHYVHENEWYSMIIWHKKLVMVHLGIAFMIPK